MDALSIFQIAERILPAFIYCNLKELNGRSGVYMAILKRSENNINPEYKLVTKLIGEIPIEKQVEKRQFAEEKVLRLHTRNSTGGGNINLSSFESEDVDRKHFGGGVTTKDFYISASGFPPHLDQKFVLILCILCNQMDFGLADKIDVGTWTKQAKWKS